MRLLITRGLPASGKSTFAKDWASQALDRVIVEKDQIRKDSRLFKDGAYNFRRGDERIVLKERDRLIREALAEGKSVISSDCNLVSAHITRMKEIAGEFGIAPEIVDFTDVPLEVLEQRDREREHPVGKQVIRDMFHKHLKKLPTFYKKIKDAPNCIICDIDGTLTTGPEKRSPYDYKRVKLDKLNLATAAILDGMQFIYGREGVNSLKVFLFSGRKDICRKDTEEWLEKYDIEYDGLFMRAGGDNRSDAILKLELFNTYIRDKYNVLFVLDDRNRVCRMWRDVLGLTVFQTGDPEYEF